MKSKKFFLSVQGVLVLLFLVSCSGTSDRVRLGEMKDLKDSASFSLGYLNGLNAAADNDAPVNADLYARGFKQAYLQDTSEVWDVNTMRDIVMEYAHRTQMAMREKSFEAAKPDIERAEKFLVENSLKEGVQTTQSGLQYKVEKQGKGRKPLKNNGERVILQYTEYELNEENKMEKVRSNVNNEGKRPGPTGIDGLCEGVKQALCLMNAGSHYVIWFHPDLGYGDSPRLKMYDLKVLEVLED